MSVDDQNKALRNDHFEICYNENMRETGRGELEIGIRQQRDDQRRESKRSFVRTVAAAVRLEALDVPKNGTLTGLGAHSLGAYILPTALTKAHKRKNDAVAGPHRLQNEKDEYEPIRI